MSTNFNKFFNKKEDNNTDDVVTNVTKKLKKTPTVIIILDDDNDNDIIDNTDDNNIKDTNDEDNNEFIDNNQLSTNYIFKFKSSNKIHNLNNKIINKNVSLSLSSPLPRSSSTLIRTSSSSSSNITNDDSISFSSMQTIPSCWIYIFDSFDFELNAIDIKRITDIQFDIVNRINHRIDTFIKMHMMISDASEDIQINNLPVHSELNFFRDRICINVLTMIFASLVSGDDDNDNNDDSNNDKYFEWYKKMELIVFTNNWNSKLANNKSEMVLNLKLNKIRLDVTNISNKTIDVLKQHFIEQMDIIKCKTMKFDKMKNEINPWKFNSSSVDDNNNNNNNNNKEDKDVEDEEDDNDNEQQKQLNNKNNILLFFKDVSDKLVNKLKPIIF